MYEMLLTASLFFAHDKREQTCPVLALLSNSKTEINLYKSGAGTCPFEIDAHVRTDNTLVLIGPHWVVEIVIPEGGSSKHWLLYQWGDSYATYRGKKLKTKHYLLGGL